MGTQGTWVEELPSILWAYRTTPKATTGESPFSLSFGVEAVHPLEVVFPTPQVEIFDGATSKSGLHASLDLVEERRANVHLHALSYKNAIARLYNRRVRPRSIRLGDLVL